ncbi:unnamed protein product [Symbiodinium sp. CCMP2592]|nr:unnamed protein product [Symbiodinium sp. CCMP2592]
MNCRLRPQQAATSAILIALVVTTTAVAQASTAFITIESMPSTTAVPAVAVFALAIFCLSFLETLIAVTFTEIRAQVTRDLVFVWSDILTVLTPKPLTLFAREAVIFTNPSLALFAPLHVVVQDQAFECMQCSGILTKVFLTLRRPGNFAPVSRSQLSRLVHRAKPLPQVQFGCTSAPSAIHSFGPCQIHGVKERQQMPDMADAIHLAVA